MCYIYEALAESHISASQLLFLDEMLETPRRVGWFAAHLPLATRHSP